MGAPNVLTLTCPHCEKQLRVGSEHAGWRTRCPHPDCRRSLTIPLLLDYDDEPEEAVLIAEGPPVPIPVIPRHKPRTEYAASPPRGFVWLWMLTAAVMLTTISLTAGWAIAKALRARSAPPTEPTRSESPKAAAPNDERPVEPPAPDEPTPQAAPDERQQPRRDQPRGREAFVGTWEVVDPQLREMKLEMTAEFRADGSYELRTDGPDAPAPRFGVWKWDGQLSLHVGGIDARPSDVRWTGPDQFVTTNDGSLTTYRRRKRTD